PKSPATATQVTTSSRLDSRRTPAQGYTLYQVLPGLFKIEPAYGSRHQCSARYCTVYTTWITDSQRGPTMSQNPSLYLRPQTRRRSRVSKHLEGAPLPLVSTRALPGEGV